jgi:hypothetical protein
LINRPRSHHHQSVQHICAANSRGLVKYPG